MYPNEIYVNVQNTSDGGTKEVGCDNQSLRKEPPPPPKKKKKKRNVTLFTNFRLSPVTVKHFMQFI